MEHHAPALAACRTIVVCDGCSVHERCKYRSGMVDPAACERYVEYKRRLRDELAARGGEAAAAPPAPPSPRQPRCEPRPVPPNVDPLEGDWACPHCGNWNWKRRPACNQCRLPPEAPPPSRVGAGRFELLELEARHGFGHAVRAALARVATPLVCVVQHDRTMMRAPMCEEAGPTPTPTHINDDDQARSVRKFGLSD